MSSWLQPVGSPTRRRSWPNSRSRRLSAEAAKNAIVARFDAQSYHESSGKRPSFLLLSNHDDRDYRTRTEGTKAKRRGRVHHCGLLRWDLPDPALAHERL